MTIGKIIFSTLTVIAIPVAGCNTLQGHKGVSDDVAESKRREVFICEYQPLQNPYVVNDTLKLEIKRAWVEKCWAYSSNTSETVIIDGYQMVIEVGEENLNGYDFTWYIGVDFDHYIRSCGKGCLMADFDSLPRAKEVWKIQAGSELAPDIKKNIIGEFTLVKKE